MYLLLKHSSGRQQAFAQYLQQLHDPQSSNFHRWLTPEQLASRFGPAPSDVRVLNGWLKAHGFQVKGLARGQNYIQFTGSAAQVAGAFGTSIHYFDANGQRRWANTSDPQIPAALAPAIGGIVGLNNFPAVPQHRLVGQVRRDPILGGWIPLTAADGSRAPGPDFTSGSGNSTVYDLGPTDIATIYNILPLWQNSIDGTGETIAVLGQSDINLADVRAYRAAFGLPANDPQTLIPPGTLDPGETHDGNEGEALLDVEVSGAVAKGATILLVPQADVVDAAAYVVDNAVAPIVNVSFGECELGLGSSGNQMFGGGGGTIGLWQQAVAEGMTVMVSSGDSGSAGCENHDQVPNAAQFGLAVSGFASTPYNVAVGGTDFNDFTNYAQYWNSSNASGTLASALSYVPEMTWNDSCASNIVLQAFGKQFSQTTNEALCNDGNTEQFFLDVDGGSGGPSNCTAPTGQTPDTCSGGYAQPAYQGLVFGVPAGANRIIPDVSLFAAAGLFGHAYVICDSDDSGGQSCNPSGGVFDAIGGTSASSPVFAGIMALVDQKQATSANPDGRQGLANTVLYQLAASEFGGPSGAASGLAACNSTQGNKVGGSCVFYDVTAGNNSVPCVTGTFDCITAVNGDQIGLIESAGVPAYAAAAGFDLATGLGSVNVANLVNGWSAGSGSIQPTTTVLSSSVTTLAEGNPVTFTASVSAASGTPSGTVVFKEGSDILIGAQTLSGGAASFSSSKLPGGTHVFNALYGGGNGFSASAAAPLSITVIGPAVSLSPTSLQLGGEALGATSAAQTITLSNPGNMPLSIGGIAVTGDFADTTTCGSSLAAGASCTISITFTPTALGTRSGALTITSNAVSSPDVAPLVGAGGTSPASFAPTSLAFGNELAGTASQPQTVTLTNTGGSTLSIFGLNISPPFSQTNGCGTALLPGASCVVTVTYTPPAVGPNGGSLSVATSASQNPAPASLSGTGTGVPAVGLSPASLSFGNQNLETDSAAQSVTLSNTGTAPLAVENISASGDFAAGSGCANVIAAGASCTINVIFTPTADGTRSGSLTVFSNALSSPNSTALSGVGVGGAPGGSSSSSSGGGSSSSSSSSGGSSGSSSSGGGSSSSGGSTQGGSSGGAFSPYALLALLGAAARRQRRKA